MKNLILRFSLLIFSLAVVLPAMTTANAQESERMDTIKGEVWYRERIALPPGSELMIALEDVAKMDVAAEVVVSDRLPLDGAPPYAFELVFDVNKLHRRGKYALRARIENNGELLFINTETFPAFPRGGAPVSVRVDQVAKSRKSGDTGEKPDASLTETYWKLVEMDAHRILTSEGQRETHLVLQSDGVVRGFAGCNWLRGDYELDGNGLTFPPVMVTRRACFPGMEKERDFLARMPEVQRYTISGDNLAMYSGDERLILRFEAVYLQ